MNELERFMAKVSPEPTSGCWLWAGGYTVQGYGTFSFRGAGAAAHRVAWELFRGHRPKGSMVRHVRCGNRACVNPDHLELGDASENAGDTVRDGRSTRGERQGGSRLTAAMVAVARSRVAAGEFVKTVAEDLRVHVKTLTSAVSGRTWRWMHEPPPVGRWS